MRDVVIVSGARTAVGSFGGSLKDVRTVDLGALVIKEAIRRAGLRPAVSSGRPCCCPDVFRTSTKRRSKRSTTTIPRRSHRSISTNASWGTSSRRGWGRIRAVRPRSSRACPRRRTPSPSTRSAPRGLKAITIAAQAISAGDAEVVVAGGMENMSNRPLRPPRCPLGVPDEHAPREDHGPRRLRRPLRDLQRLPHGASRPRTSPPAMGSRVRSRTNWP